MNIYFNLVLVGSRSALTCYEAMACGLPLIVIYNTGSVARDGVDGFIIELECERFKKEDSLFI